MQLPPTIISLNRKKKKKDPVAAKSTGKKTTTPKAKSGPNEKPAVSEPPQTPRDEDHEANPTGASDEEGDTAMKDDGDVPPPLDETKSDTSASGGKNPPTIKALRRGTLEPPRTLETTLFDRLEKMYGPGIKRLLNVQYRYMCHLLEWMSR